MPRNQHLEVLSRGPLSRVRLLTDRPFDAETFAELTAEWNSVADRVDCLALLVDCSKVQFLSSEILSRLVLLQRRLKQKKAKLVLSGLRAEVREVLNWTKLDRFFEIKEDEKLEAAVLA
ncbi:MAG: STAS domain-containing protein [Thermoguttaceae bacterium]|jgi:anti-anti-sigma factor